MAHFERIGLLFTILALPVVSGRDSEILASVVVFRHGHRTLWWRFPKDPYANISYWPEGYGQLTQLGKISSYKLGQWLRQRYDSFVPQKYNSQDIYVRSTDNERTLISAALVLEGLYPRDEANCLEPYLENNLIPIHTVEEKRDAVLQLWEPCPKHELIQNDLEAFLSDDPIATSLTNNVQDLYEDLARKTGGTFTNWYDVAKLYSALYVEKANNLTIPDWGEEMFPLLKDFTRLAVIMPCYTKELARLKIGPFFNELLEYFSEIATFKSGEYHKMRLYASHDVVLMNIMNTLGVLGNRAEIAYSSAIIFELRTRGEQTFLEIFLREGQEFSQLKIDKCIPECDLEDFQELVKDIVITQEEWFEECQLYKPNIYASLLYVFGSLFVLVSIAYVIIFYLFLK